MAPAVRIRSIYDVATNRMPTSTLASCDSSLFIIAESDTSWYTVAFSGPLRNYLLQAGHTYALGVSIPSAGSSISRSIKNITEPSTPYTMAPGYTFVRNVSSTSAIPSWSYISNRFGIVLTGTEVPRTPTTTSISADVNPATYGVPVIFTATVSPDAAGGLIVFKDGGVTLGTGTVSGGVATFTTRSLGIGRHDMTAEYGGDESYEPSASPPSYTQEVVRIPNVITLAATNVLVASASLNGRVNPNGLTADSSFQYATNAGWLVSTLAGGTNSGYADGFGAEAYFTCPAGVAMDDDGNAFVADTLNNRIRRITPFGMVTTLAGTNFYGYFDGTGCVARFYAPYGVALDGAGNLFVADYFNQRIRKITMAGVVTTLAGTNAGYADGPGGTAQFFRPQGVAVDGAGNVVVADTYNNCIRQVSPAGVVTTLAGTNVAGYLNGMGSAALFFRPQGVAVDGAGNVYVADTINNCIRQITAAGVVTTLAGSTNAGYADGPIGTAKFRAPSGVAVDRVGNVYVADYNNHRIRQITPDGMVKTLAGTNSGYADGPGGTAQFNAPFSLAVDRVGNVYVADYNNNRIRKIENNLIEPVTTVAAQSGLAGSSTVSVSHAISGLLPGKTYYFQALASIGADNYRGSVISFTTVGACVQTLAVTNSEATVRFYGIVGESYYVERTTSMTEPVVWTNLTLSSPLMPGPDGAFQFTDGDLPQTPKVFYRLLQYSTQP
jgi:sugar lactone lactonase YvrE